MEDLKKKLYERIPYYSTLGLELQEIGNGKAIFEILIREELTQNGMVHGGVIASLIDSSCACAAISLVYPDGYITTIDLQVEFLKPATKGILKAKAKCTKAGKTIFFCKAKVWNNEGELISTGSSQLLRIS
ncbi:MAG: PaaI family thioesterase [Candidatus Lokiarchaeota archaeon]|nr:PaaI family thioesterase [Candidatus Lokiarchaeota archaeon]